MKKKFCSKPKGADIFSLIKRILLIGFAIFLAYVAFTELMWFLKVKEDRKRAIGYLGEVCEYVKENETAFREFSKYNSSQLSDDEDVIIFERNGDMQKERDIIFKYFHVGKLWLDEGEPFTRFDGYYGSSYRVVFFMKKNTGKKYEDDELGKVINDDMYIFLVRYRE